MHELCLVPATDPQHVVTDQHLGITIHAGTDADHGNSYTLGDLFGEFRRHTLKQQHADTGLLQ